MDKQLKTNIVICGDCREVLHTLPDDCVDLIITSPPYADSRKKTYGGIHPKHYAAWFLPIAAELRRVLKPTASFVLNIKEKVVKGERDTYVLEIILGMRRQGWLWTEEYCWHKKNCYPGKWRNRFRDSWERCLHFTKKKNFNMYQEAVMVPIGKWSEKRLANPSKNDAVRLESQSKSGFGKRVQNWIGREMVYPTNVLHLATECSNKRHSAAFPEELPEWFIKLFTREGDVVLDPFLGSGTAAVAAKRLNRPYVGIEIKREYCELAEAQLATIEESLFTARIPNHVAK